LGENAAASDFAGVDFEAWRVEVRALAAAEAIRRDGAPLRTALAALVGEAANGLAGEAQLAPHIEADSAARALLQRVVDDWLGRGGGAAGGGGGPPAPAAARGAPAAATRALRCAGRWRWNPPERGSKPPPRRSERAACSSRPPSRFRCTRRSWSASACPTTTQ